MLDIVGLNYDEMLLQLASGDGMLPKSVENIQPSITIATKAMQKRNLAIMQAISEVGFQNAQSTSPNDMSAMVVNENDKKQKRGSRRLTGGAMPNNGNIFKGCVSAMPMSMSFHNQWTMMQKHQMQMQLMRNFNNAQQHQQWQQQQRQQDYITQPMQYSQINQPPNAHGGMIGLPIPQWAYANGNCQLNPRTGQEEMTMLFQDNTIYSNGPAVNTPYENFSHTMPCRPCYGNSNCELKSQVTKTKIPKISVDVTTSTSAQQSLTCNSSCISINESSLQETSSELVMQEYRRRRGGSQRQMHPSRAELMQQLEDLKKRLQDKDSGKIFKYKNNARSRKFWESSSSVFTPKASLKPAITCHQRTYKPYIYPSDSPFCSEKVKSQMIVNYTPVRGTKSEPETRHIAKTHATFSDSKMLKKRHRHQKQQQHQQKSSSSHNQQKLVSKHKSHHHKSKKKISKTSKTKTKNNQEELDNLKHTSKDFKGKEVKASSSRQKTKFKESVVWSFNGASEKVNATNGKTNQSNKSTKNKKGSILHYVDPKKSIHMKYNDKPDTMIFNHVPNGASHTEAEDTLTINGKKPVNIYVHYR